MPVGFVTNLSTSMHSAEGTVSQKTKRLSEVSASDLNVFATTNTSKEQLCLEYVDNFRAQVRYTLATTMCTSALQCVK
jgi:hypothetical protein